MARVIRQSIFETNSSSSHALSIKSIDEAKADSKRTFVITDPLPKLVWFFCVTTECENNYKGKIGWYSGGKPLDEIRREITEIVRDRHAQANGNDSWYFDATEFDFDNWTADEMDNLILLLYDDHEEFGEPLQVIRVAETRESVHKLKQDLIRAYSEAEHITEAETLERIDKEYNNYNELVLAIADPEKHKRALWILRRCCGMCVDDDYKKAADKQAFLENRKKKFERCELNKDTASYSCTRFFCEGALYECDCGFAQYDELWDNFEGFKDPDGIRKFLSGETAVVGYER